MTGAEPTPLATFAAEVRAQRNRLGWSQVMLGEKIGYSGSFVSDVERCERPPSTDFAKGCDREFGLPETMVRLYALIQRNAYPAWFSPVVPLERKAVRIHGWEPFVVPGLLQTEEYARELIRVSRPQDSAAAVEELVTARMERQAILARDDPPMLWYVLDEGILHRVVGSAELMDAQLERLITAASAGGTVIQVLSFSAGDQPGADGPLTVYEFPDAPTVCYTECYRGGRLVEETSEVADMITTVSMIRAAALSPRASLELMRRIRRENMSADGTWRKSSYSGGQGGNCVEVAARPADQLAVRDSKDQAGPVLRFPREAWGAFMAGIRQREELSPR